MDDNDKEMCEFCSEEFQYNNEHVCYNDMADSSAQESQQEYVNAPSNTIEDIETFIETVAQTRILWDHTIPYAKRGAASIKMAWADIDTMYNVIPGTSQTKWRNLRDTYIRKLTEQKKYVASGSAASCKPKKESWPYFEIMEFLRPCVSFKRTYSNIQAPIERQSHSTLSSDNQMTSLEANKRSFKRPIKYSQELQLSKPVSDHSYPSSPSPTDSLTNSASDASQKLKRSRISKKVSTNEQSSPFETNLWPISSLLDNFIRQINSKIAQSHTRIWQLSPG